MLTNTRTRHLSIILTMIVLLFSGLMLNACSPASKNTDQSSKDSVKSNVFYSFTDDADNKITLTKQPKTVAVLFSSYADIWTTAGGKVAITVGESIERGFASKDTPLVDQGAGKTIDTELLLSYKPDFVICSTDIPAQVKTAGILNEAGIPCAQFHVESFDDYLAMLDICTDITGNKEAFTTYGAEVKTRIEQIKKSVKNAVSKEQPKILFVRAGSKYSATKAKTADDNFVCTMLKELGTYNIAENAPVLLDGLSFEEILLSNPDYIFISTMGDEQAAKAYMDSILSENNWQELDAVKNNRYAYLPKDLFQYKPNAKWDQAYQYLIDLLNPGDN